MKKQIEPSFLVLMFLALICSFLSTGCSSKTTIITNKPTASSTTQVTSSETTSSSTTPASDTSGTTMVDLNGDEVVSSSTSSIASSSSDTSPTPTGTTVPTNSSPENATKPADPTPPTTQSNGSTVIDVPKLCQIKVKCPNPRAACGPTALAMIVSFFNKEDPGKLATQLWTDCRASSNSGTGHKGLTDGAKKHGFPNAKWSYGVGFSWLKTQIKAGKPVICHVSHHYVVVKGFDNKGNVIINDPGKGVVNRVMPYDKFAAWWKGGSNNAAMTLN